MFGQTSKAKIILLTVATLLLTTGFNTVFPASRASADVKGTPYLQDVYVDSVYKKASAHQHYWFLYSCFRNVNIDKVTKTEVDSWDFFEGSGAKSALGAMYTPSDGNGYYRECSTGSMVKTAFNYLGFDNSRETFCSMEGAQYEDDHDGNRDDCIAGAGGHDWDNNASLTELTAWFKDEAGPKKPAFGAPEEYMRSFASFVEGCDISFNNDTLYDTAAEVPGADTSSTQYAVPVIIKQGDSLVTKFVQGVGETTATQVVTVATSAAAIRTAVLPSTSYSCGDLINLARANVEAYRAVAEREGVTETTDDPEGGSGAETTTCGIDGIGWIVCPVMTFMAKLNDSAFGFLRSLLEIRPALITDPATIKAWSAFRDIANVAFIIAFLVIVYSQITGAGVSNYGIKKLLPRIFVSAVLVNLSYFICALAVDVSNIAGSSIYSLLGDAIPVSAGGATNGAFANGWQDTVGPILAAAATAVVLLVVIIPVLPVVLLALAVILFILIARQALVILLIVAAPLAFVAYLLPNTESWFKKWRQAFVTVLMVYPIIGGIFGASTLAATVLMGVANNPSTGDDQQLLKIVALAVLAVPLFAVPAALKGSLSAAGAVGARLSNLSDRTSKMASGSIRDRTKDLNNKRKIAALDGTGASAAIAGGFGITRRRARRDFLRSSRDTEAKRAESTYMSSMLGAKDEDGNYTNSAERLQNAAAGGGVLRQANQSAQVRAAAQATQGLHKQYDDDVKAFKTTLTSKRNDELVKMLSDSNLSSEQTAAAAGLIMSRDHRESHLLAIDAVGKRMQAADSTNNTKEKELVSDVQKQMAHDMKDKPWALGDQAVGQLVTGDYGKKMAVIGTNGAQEVDEEGNPKFHRQFGDIQGELQERVGTKLSASSLADMNPDEMKRIHQAAMKGDLTGDQLASLKKAITDARSNRQIGDRIKPEAATLHDEILANTKSNNRVPNNAETRDEADTYNTFRDGHVNDVNQAHEEAIDINLRRSP